MKSNKISINRKEKVVIASIIGNIILTTAKIILSNLSGSIALIADAWHSFSDVLVSIIVLAGFITIRILKNREDKDNKGRSKLIIIENIVAMIIGLFIIALSFSILHKVFFAEKLQISNLVITIIGQTLIIGFIYLLYKYKNIIGTEEDSAGIIADSFHTKSDMFTSVGVLLSLIGYLIGLNFDKIVAVIIFFLIFYQGLETIINALRSIKRKDETVIFINDNLPFIKKITNVLKTLTAFIKQHKIKAGAITTVIGVFIYIFFGFYIVEQDERAVRFFLGKADEKNIQPGLHFDILHPFSEIITMNTLKVSRMEIGFKTKFHFDSEENKSDIYIYQWESNHYSNQYKQNESEAQILTGGGNIINANLIIDYTINNLYDYLMNINDPVFFMHETIESLLVKEFGKHNLFDALLDKRLEIEKNIKNKLQNTLDEYKTGIHAAKLTLFDVHPAVKVMGAFRRVTNDEEYKKTKIYEALSYKSKHIPYTKGLAHEIKQEALAEAVNIIQSAKTSVEILNVLIDSYKENPAEVKLRLITEVFTENLSDKNKIMIIGNSIKDKIIMGFGDKNTTKVD